MINEDQQAGSGEKLDLSDPVFLQNRRDSYRRLRNDDPIARTELNGEKTVVLTRYEDITAILKDKRSLMQPAVGEFPAYIGNGPAGTFYRLSLPSIDADHTRLRKIVAPAFTPQNIARFEGWVAEIIDRRIDEIANKPVIDVVAALSDAIPVDVACKLFHIPREDAAPLVSRVNELNAVLAQADMTPEQLARSDEAASVFFKYFRQLVEGHRDLPESDIVGALSKAELSGEMSSEQVDTFLVDIFLGNYHTTMVAFTNAIHALALFPEQRAALAADPSLAARSWEEVLRFDSPVHFRHRYVSEPVTLRGYTIEPRVKIMLGLASANWDEAAFEHPNAFDIARPTNRHVTFGGGGHFCLGSQLSRLEGKLFFPKFLARFPNFRLTDPLPVRSTNLTFPFMERLSIEIV
jgi:cytochrome P450